MIINGHKLLSLAPIANMATHKIKEHGVSYGLSEAGYDIRIKQDIVFSPTHGGNYVVTVSYENEGRASTGRFVLASAVEEFQMPMNLVGIVHDKSTWARHGLSVFNTVIEPGWNGYLTLELVYHGNTELVIPAGAGIAQVIFHEIAVEAAYGGKYQNQENMPIPPRKSV